MAVPLYLPPDSGRGGPEKGRRPARERECFTKKPALEGIGEHGGFLLPICPALRVLCDRGKRDIDFGGMTTNSDMHCIGRIVAVCNYLFYLAPNMETLAFFAHRTNLLKDCLDLIRLDLASLPKRLEKDYPDTSKRCAELVKELGASEEYFQMSRTARLFLLPECYVKLPGSSLQPFPKFLGVSSGMLATGKAGTLPGFEGIPFPPNEPLPKVECSTEGFLAWQQQTVRNYAAVDRLATRFKGLPKVGQIHHLVNYYPSLAIIAAGKLLEELVGVAPSLAARTPAAMTAEIEPLQQTAGNLREFAKSHWIGRELSPKDCDKCYHELIACFHPSFEYSLKRLAQHGHADSAADLKNHQRDFYEKVRVQYLPSEPNLRVLFPDNLRVEILSLAEEIERTIAHITVPAPGVNRPQYMFKNAGATWRIIYDGRETNVEDSKGIKYIHHLLQRPNTPIECLDIERACSTESPEGGRRLDSGEAAEADLHADRYDLKRLDDWEAKDIESALNKLKADIEDTGDPGRKTKLQKDADHLTEYLRKNLNKHGQPRSVDKREQIRSRVQKAINAAKRAIKKADEHIGSHFEAVKGEGTAYIYKPSSEIPWTFE